MTKSQVSQFLRSPLRVTSKDDASWDLWGHAALGEVVYWDLISQGLHNIDESPRYFLVDSDQLCTSP